MKKIEIIDERTVSVDGVIFERKEPEFKVGQWVIGVNGYTPTEPARLISFNSVEANYIYWNNGLKDERESWEAVSHIRPATHSEIEEHLIKVAKEKGFKTGVKRHYPKLKNVRVGEIKEPLGYNFDSDSLTCDNGYIIWDGRDGWAEILPDKKKLPKTKEEFEAFLDEWINSPVYQIGRAHV